MTVLDPRPVPARAPFAPLPRVDPVTKLPILILYPHSRCNCRCVMCDIWRASGKEELSVAELRSWIDEWTALGVERVVLSGGEALLHSDLWTFCDALHDAGIGITMLSTGLLLARHATDVVKRCDDVVVSVDGPRAIHDAIRNIPRAFDRLVEGVAALKAADARVSVTGRCTVQKANFEALRETVQSAHDAQLDRISFLAADVSSDAFNRPGGWEADRVQSVSLTAEDLPLLAAELDRLEQECAADFESGFIAESPEKLRRRLHQYYSALNGVGDFAPNNCNAPWVSAVIEADGTVRPCFFQPPMGNIRQRALSEILNSDDALTFRRGLDITRNAICRKCVCTLSLGASTKG